MICISFKLKKNISLHVFPRSLYILVLLTYLESKSFGIVLFQRSFRPNGKVFFPRQPKVPVTHLFWNFVTGTFDSSRAYSRKLSRASSKISRPFFLKVSRVNWKFHGQVEKKLSRAV